MHTTNPRCLTPGTGEGWGGTESLLGRGGGAGLVSDTILN